ncbi:hypothetical protein VitviT2T_025915 [Vitis vinifera]|uniref:Uncharacterized protein n=1 Tax=Vitis vinifera TaxID=29760 RepID=A0ABY9DMR9_VITVI|nr:hypothetical protein VitviT2T_025915 [Vitis vinifera]
MTGVVLPLAVETIFCEEGLRGSNKLLDIFFRILDQFLLGMKQIHQRKLMNNRAIEVLKVLRDEVSTLKDQQLVKAGVHSAIFVAVENGLIEFVVEIIKSHPLLLWVRNANGESIIKAAVVHRQEKIFNLIHGMGGQKTRLVGGRDKFGNNILHLAARLATASQLDREVERIVNPKYLEEKNDDGKVPRTLFTEEHKHLVKEGEKWMKDTAAACMVVSTLSHSYVCNNLYCPWWKFWRHRYSCILQA